MAAAAAGPQLDGLELLPEPDGLELLPERDGLLDALDDTIAVAPAEAPLRPLPAPRPLPSKTKRRKAERNFWQLPAIQASGGVLTSLLVIAGIGLKIYYRVVTPIVNNSASSVAATMIAEAETVLSGIKRNVQMAQQMTDAVSAQRLAGDWALQFIDAIDAGERLDRHAGTLIPLKDKKTYEDLAKSCESQVAILNAHLTHLATIPNVQPILADALDKAIAARPTSKFAQTLRSQGMGSYGISGVTRMQAELQADQEARRAEAKAEEDARMAKMKADHDARAAQMKAESDAQMAQMKADAERRTAEIQERMRAQSDSMRNLHPPGMRRGIRP